MSDCVVYWLYDAYCNDVQQHGYVGITANLEKRIKQHRYHLRRDFIVAVLYRGTAAQCLALEAALRPDHNIGWNRSKGGPNQGRTLGYKYSEEGRSNISKALRGHKHSAVTKKKLAEASTGYVRSEASRANQSAATKGKPKSEKHKAAIAAATRRRYAREGEREKTSRAVKAAFAAMPNKGE